MIEIRLHGRGGQGVVTAAELVASAAFSEGKFTQAFPYFGVERRGAPIEAFARIDDNFIRLRQRVYNPDFIIILDDTLLGTVDVLVGAKKETQILINSAKKSEAIAKEYAFLKPYQVITVPAIKIALDIISKPIINTVMLGVFAAVSDLVCLDSVKKTIQERFPGQLGEKNIKAAEEGYRVIKS